ncbi:MAG: FkbM family methyltransferase [Candidatus Komeilibacteria bacterium]|nr:FkbM family methyltransferase [Candidatus Komeilibacteria bacterium]
MPALTKGDNAVIHKHIQEYNSRHNGDVFFVQIGSNDGKTGDPIYQYVTKHGWRGILVEPIPWLFARLKENYAGYGGLTFENLAVAEETGYKTFHYLDVSAEKDVPWWFDQLGSFKKEILFKHKKEGQEFDKFYRTKEIEAVTVAGLLDKHTVERIDLLHIDTEGYDYEIIKHVPYERVKPVMILYEHRHLTADDKVACESLLLKKGYDLIEAKHDTLAIISQ